MKFLRLLLIALSLTIAAPTFTGCTSPPRTHEAIVFDTCKTTYNAARETYKAVVKLHLSGKIDAEKRKQADDAWNKFRASFSLTMKTLTLNWETATPQELTVLANNFVNFIESL